MDLADIYDQMVKGNLKKNNPSPELKKKKSDKNFISEQKIILNEDPLAKFFFKLQDLKKIDLKTKTEKQIFERKIVSTEIVEEKTEIVEEIKEEPLAKFFSKLQAELSKKIERKNKIKFELENLNINDENEPVNEEENVFQNTSNNYIQELIKTDKNSSREKKLIKENEDLSMQISTLQYQINRMKAEAGTWGGGDIGGGPRGYIDESVFKKIVETVEFVNSNAAEWQNTSTLIQDASATWVVAVDGGQV